MKPITESFVNKHLRRATKTLMPRRAEALWAEPVEKASGDEWYLDGTGPKKRRTGRTIGMLSALAACLAVCFLSLYMVNFRVEATVYLDVNPSVTIQANCGDKVIRARANNPDGEIILEDMELKNTDLNVAVNAVIGSMVRHGYLTEARDVVLLSVSSGSAEKTEALRARLSGEINDCLTALVGAGTVFDQEVEKDKALETLAEKYGITPGKAALIRRVVEAHPEMDYDTLAKLPMKELAGYLTASGVDLRDYINATGAPFDSAAPEDALDRDDPSDRTDEPDDLDTEEPDTPDAEDMEEPAGQTIPEEPDDAMEDAMDDAAEDGDELEGFDTGAPYRFDADDMEEPEEPAGQAVSEEPDDAVEDAVEDEPEDNETEPAEEEADEPEDED